MERIKRIRMPEVNQTATFIRLPIRPRRLSPQTDHPPTPIRRGDQATDEELAALPDDGDVTDPFDIE